MPKGHYDRANRCKPKTIAPFTRLDAAKIPAELREGWKLLQATPTKLTVKRAIYRAVALNQTWDDACRAEKVNRKHAWQVARAYALAGRTRKALGEGFARILSVGQDILEEKLLDPTIAEDLSVRDVTAVVASAGAQLAKTWEQEDQGTSYATALDRLAARLGQAGGEISLTLRVSPVDSAIDVTPLDTPELSA